MLEDTHDGKHNIKIADTSIQCITSLIPHKFTVKSQYKYVCQCSVEEKMSCQCLVNESRIIDNPHGKIACKPGSIALKYESVCHYAPELFEQMFVHGDKLQETCIHRWNQGLHSGTSATESKLIASLRLDHNVQTDLFAFGTILFHLFSGHLPWYNHNKKATDSTSFAASLTSEQVILFRMIYNQRLGVNELQTPFGRLKESLRPKFLYLNCCDKKQSRVRDVNFNSGDIWSIIERCWKPESERLDTFKQVQESLEKLQQVEDDYFDEHTNLNRTDNFRNTALSIGLRHTKSAKQTNK